MGKKRSKKPKQLGDLLPRHNFFLNPYTDARFTRCPQCDAKTKLRKKPLFIFIAFKQPVSLNKTCRYCPNCDLLIAHKDEIDQLINSMCFRLFPHLIGQDYLVVGTIERKPWKEGSTPSGEIFKSLHDFKKHLEFEPTRYIWVKEDE